LLKAGNDVRVNFALGRNLYDFAIAAPINNPAFAVISGGNRDTCNTDDKQARNTREGDNFFVANVS
jgi:hypothetical protein